jgi:hypothetical protein
MREGKRKPSRIAPAHKKKAIIRLLLRVRRALACPSEEESVGNITITTGMGRKRMIFPTI